MRRWMNPIALAGAIAALACAGGGVPAALAAGGNPVINDCQSSGVLTHQYTPQQLHHALAVMSATTKQYTDCYDVIQQALAKGARTGAAPGPGSGSGGSFLPTPVIVILVLLILAAVTFGAIAIRRRRTDAGAGAGDPDGDGPADGESS